MSHLSSPVSPQSAGQISQDAPIRESQHHRPPSTSKSIHVLDDDSLLGVFYLHRLLLLEEDETRAYSAMLGGDWDRERWWYKLVHVCRRWRHLILGSASHLCLRLLCTNGTPIADILTHAPPLPLILDYFESRHDITTKDEEGIARALQHRHRVHSVRLVMPVQNLQKLVSHLASSKTEFMW
ncbi:hypothetical protein BC826DRAFT_640606 [Russula brevipes]|nr:hypothetical protein BC826DRAFT_640606 [Russula brevipes]